MRIGFGFDVHPFSEASDSEHPTGRSLVLAGVRVPGAPPLKGHSDADVVCHALADAFLGAAGLGDIGQHFPDTDERWAGANSLQLLELCVEMANGAGLSLLNADVTVVAEIPRLAPYVDAMTTQLRTVARGDVSVKVKRAEGLGALGRAEGIACFAVALLGDQSEGSS